MLYPTDKKKKLGAYYTPQILSDLLARLLVPFCKSMKNDPITVLDPATGDSILLESFEKYATKKKIDTNLIGIDIDEDAIKKSTRKFGFNNKYKFFNTDALYPLGYSCPLKGWDDLITNHITSDIDLIVSNPPWGADINHHLSLSSDFATAVGQFDIYDLFIETIIDNLRQDGVYGIIIPDSIYCQEHKKIRKILLTNTTIKGIIRLGEGFFPEVNFAVSIIYGVKNFSPKYDILCSHINNFEKKKILSGEVDILTVISNKAIKVSAKQMIAADYSFTIDVSNTDILIINKLKKYDVFKSHISCQRGVELSKRGNILQCIRCGEWFPMPRVNAESTICPHCKTNVTITNANKSCIITNRKEDNCVQLITGEDISRFFIVSNRYIRQGVQGINYKSLGLYQGTKVLVRKTGVGITAGIDYNNSLTNQVVYIVKPKSSAHSLITAEVITAILCSRLITYVIIKEKGSIGWTSNPYLSQKDVNMLPFPILDFDNQDTIKSLKRITEIVKEQLKKNNDISDNADAEIERIVATLYKLSQTEYETIFSAIGQVEKMIPFKRLLNINIDDIFQDGI